MSILPILPVPPTQYTLGEGGAGVQQQAGYRVPHAREDGAPAPWMLQQSEEGGPTWMGKGYRTTSPCCGGGVASICPSLGLPLWFPICSYLNKKKIAFSG
ncbi:rCG61008, isoform CRA_b, partial [Rattus norvegicus]